MTTRTVAGAGGRGVTFDDVGDPGGASVVYLHGTPDSRLARHPDDGLAAAAGVRLLAVDRPGYGGTDPFPAATGDGWPAVWAADIAAVLDALGVDRAGVLAWSGGALGALAVAAERSDRVAALGLVAGLVPRQAYADPEVRRAGAARLDLLELADSLPPDRLGATVAPLLAPWPCDRALALEHQAEQRDAAAAAELAAVPGGADRMADGLVEAVRRGLAGVAADVEAQARPLAVDLAAVAPPVRLWYGSDDTVTPPAFGRWYAARLPGATLTEVAGATHYLAFTAWSSLLAAVAPA